MSNEVTTTTGFGALANMGSNVFVDRAREEGARDGNFLMFSGQTGTFEYGSKDDRKEMDHGAQFVCEMFDFTDGWVCWVENTVADNISVRLTEGKPTLEKDLPDHGPYKEAGPNEQQDGWHPQVGMPLVNAQTGERFRMNLSAKGGIRAFWALVMAFGKGMARNKGKLPIIEIGANRFETKSSTGKKQLAYAPTFEIVGWIDEVAYTALLEGAETMTAAAEEGATDEGADNPANYQQQEKAAAAAASAGGRRSKGF